MVPEILAQDVKSLLENGKITLLDVRNPDEIEIACVKGALVVALPTLAHHINDVPRDKPVVTMCHHGVRSQKAAEILVQQGFLDVKSMKGGIDAWSVDVDESVKRY